MSKENMPEEGRETPMPSKAELGQNLSSVKNETHKLPQTERLSQVKVTTSVEAARVLSERGIRPIRGGAGWLYDNEEDLSRAIPDVGIREIIKLAEAEDPYDEAGLKELRADLRGAIMAGKITAEAAQPFLAKIRARSEDARPVEKITSLPRNPEEQRKIVEKVLETIESTDYPLDAHNLNHVNELSRVMETMEPELAAEVQARVRLHACFTELNNLTGDSEQAQKDLRSVAQKLNSRNLGLEAEDFDRLLKKGIRNKRVDLAFYRLQEWAINGRRIVRNGEEEVVRYKQGGVTAGEQRQIMEDVIGEIQREGNMSEKDAHKSMQLAVRIAVATFETSVWNKDFQGPDPLAEAIYLRKYREGRSESGRDRGPEATVNNIEGFGSSFFRRARKADKTPLAPKIEISSREIADNYDREVKETLANLRIEDDHQTLLDFGIIEFNGLTPHSYAGYLAGEIPQVLAAKLLLLKTDFKSDEINTEQVQKWVAPFRAADPDGSLRLKMWFALGLFDHALKLGGRYGWGYIETKNARQAMSSPVGQDKNGDLVYFLSNEEMDAVMKGMGVTSRTFKNDLLLNLRGAFRVRR